MPNSQIKKLRLMNPNGLLAGWLSNPGQLITATSATFKLRFSISCTDWEQFPSPGRPQFPRPSEVPP